MNERLLTQTVPISEPIKRNNLHLFSRSPVREKSSKQLQLSSQSNCSLFSRLNIASKSRNGDLDEFFKLENQAYPPSLSQMGVLRIGTRSDLLRCLQDLTPVNENVSSPTVQVNAAIVSMLRPGPARKFHDVFVPYITSQLQHVSRLDTCNSRELAGTSSHQ